MISRLVEILQHDGAMQDNRRIRRLLQGTAEPKPKMEVLRGPGAF